jgi:hypothetical protein
MNSIVTDSFPPMSINESKIVVKWLNHVKWLNQCSFSIYAPDSFESFQEIFINKFHDVTNPPAGQTISMMDRLYKFGFTKVDGTIYNNPFSELVCLIFITNIASEKDDENEKTRVHNILLNKWDKLLNYLNLKEKTRASSP